MTSPRAMIVDHQAHLLPRSYFESILGRTRYPRAERDGDGYRFEPAAGDAWSITAMHVEPELQFASMDELGIGAMVSSPNAVGDVAGLELAEACEAVEVANEETARVQAQHPDRFIGLAMLPMQETDAALTCLERALGTLGLAGVCMVSNIAGRPLVSEATLPVFRRIGELGVPLYLHPAGRSAAFALELGPVVEVGLSWMFDTSVAALSLITSGVLDASPGLCVVHPHLGGVLPYVVGRVSNVDRMASASYNPGGPARTSAANELPVEAYLRSRFYVDTVGATPGALPLAVRTYGVERVLLGTDFPWLQDRRGRLDYVTESLPERDAAMILRNAPAGLRTPARSRRRNDPRDGGATAP